jgi:hypothetical protein
MEYKIEITDESGNIQKLTINSSFPDEKKSLDDFILDALMMVSERERRLPFIILCPNGLEVYPSLKRKFENDGIPTFNAKLEAMVVTWRE